MISDDMVIKRWFAFKYCLAMVTRILFRYNTTPRRNRCYKFFMISEDMGIKSCFLFKYRMAMVTRVLFLFRSYICNKLFMIFDDMVIKKFLPSECRIAMHTLYSFNMILSFKMFCYFVNCQGFFRTTFYTTT
ncbi:unnamed protein product [Callosobruchus maculatus]|uniref:Uncharacterized protein n=1 Tax=Callosobruchus maculatus TaxID=64391 RepID=A0A653CKA7_CALMS|nr:unnamed protein product [Callosobruchus maculatus]